MCSDLAILRLRSDLAILRLRLLTHGLSCGIRDHGSIRSDQRLGSVDRQPQANFVSITLHEEHLLLFEDEAFPIQLAYHTRGQRGAEPLGGSVPAFAISRE